MDDRDHKNRIAVLLSTYNGEKFVSELIDSVLNQIDVNVHIFVRDDGSTDRTLDILNKYDPNDLTFFIGQNVGAANSFMKLIYEESVNGYSYYALADQDDIWFPDKLITAIHAIEENRNDLPVLYACNQKFVDEEGHDMGNRLPEEFAVPSIYNILFGNNLSGCTMVFNDLLRNELISKRASEKMLQIRMHDLWIAVVASITGEIIYDKNPHILFRRHGDNTSDGRTSSEIRKNRKIKDYIEVIKRSPEHPASMVAEEILRMYSDKLACEDKQKLSLLADYYTALSRKLKLLVNRELKEAWGVSKMTYYGKIILNRM